MCLRDLRGTLGTDPDYARGLLAKLIDSITLRKKGGLGSEYDNHACREPVSRIIQMAFGDRSGGLTTSFPIFRWSF